MKGRTKRLEQRRTKKEERRQAGFRSKGNSPYANKVKAGQMYGPMPKVPKWPDFEPGWRIR